MLGWRKDKKEAEPGGVPEPSAAPAAPSSSTPSGPERRRLGEMLLDEGIITKAQLDDAVGVKEEKGGFIGQALVELGHVDQRTLISFLVKQCKIPYISLLDYEISKDLLSLIPQETCLHYRLLPIDKMGRILTVAMVDPLDPNALDSVREACPDLRLKPILCDWNHYDTVAKRLFAQGEAAEPQEMTAKSLGLSSFETGAPPASEPEEEQASGNGEGGEEEALNKAVADLLSQAGAESGESHKPKQDPGEALTALMEEQERKKAQEQMAPPPPADDEEPEAGEQYAQSGQRAVSHAPGPSREEMTAAIRDGVHGAMSESLKSLGAEIRESLASQVAQAEPGASPAGPTPDELALVLGESVQGAMDKSLKSLGAEIRESLASHSAQVESNAASSASGPTADELSAVLRESVHGAMSESMKSLGAEIRKSLASQAAQAGAGAPPAGPTADELSVVLGDGVQKAMDKSLKALGAEIRESLASHSAQIEASAASSASGPTADELAVVLRESVQGAMDKSLKALGAEIRESLAAQSASAKSSEKAAAWNPEALAAGLKEPLAKAMDGAVSKSMEQVGVLIAREMKAAVPKQNSVPAPPTPEAMAGAVREAVTEGVSAPLQKSMDALGKEFKQALAQQKTPPPSVSAEDIAGAIRDSVGEAFASTAKSITKEIQGLQAAQATAPDPGVYVETMQTALSSAVKEAVAPFNKSVEAQRAQEDERLQALQEAFETQSKEASRTGTAVQAAMKELRAALAAQQKDAGSGAVDGQLQEVVSAAREAAEAAKQAVEAMQTTQTPARHPFAPAGGTGAAPSGKGVPGAISVSAPADEAAVTPFPKQHKGAGDAARGEKEVLETIDGPGAKTRSDARVREALDSEHPQTAHTFDRFFVSKANQFAFAMAQAVAQEPGGEYSPFYIHGDVGVGKTHLINAIANGVRAMDPDRRVGYVTASRFAERLEEALHRHEAAKVRHAYAQWDVLVVDDVQFLAGRAAAQEELFHILNALGREDRQIILAGAAAPANLTGVDKGLVSRFNGGIVSALEAPDHATRSAILEHQAAVASVRIPREILEAIASRVPHDMRKMTGALRKVIAFAGLVGHELDSAQGWEILDQLGITEAA